MKNFPLLTNLLGLPHFPLSHYERDWLCVLNCWFLAMFPGNKITSCLSLAFYPYPICLLLQLGLSQYQLGFDLFISPLPPYASFELQNVPFFIASCHHFPFFQNAFFAINILNCSSLSKIIIYDLDPICSWMKWLCSEWWYWIVPLPGAGAEHPFFKGHFYSFSCVNNSLQVDCFCCPCFLIAKRGFYIFKILISTSCRVWAHCIPRLLYRTSAELPQAYIYVAAILILS